MPAFITDAECKKFCCILNLKVKKYDKVPEWKQIQTLAKETFGSINLYCAQHEGEYFRIKRNFFGLYSSQRIKMKKYKE